MSEKGSGVGATEGEEGSASVRHRGRHQSPDDSVLVAGHGASDGANLFGFTHLQQLWRTGQLQRLPQLQNGGGIGVPVRKERKDTRGHDKRGRTFGGASLLPDSPETTPPSLPAASWTSIIIRTSLPDSP
ncbi:hypothetical protein NPIL_184481 [Nephila pilipes]|uniref:Uncharacterized protein n=1 Tax=Nephila pilipes TaxID=299642 RepID=A0A8X6UPT8_NEPPI|nr:hypothetical protein NPIL_184481 [Nephila pilipes]